MIWRQKFCLTVKDTLSVLLYLSLTKSKIPLAKAGFQQEACFNQQIGYSRKELKQYCIAVTFTWCWNLRISETRPHIPRKFWNVALKKDGEDQLDRSYERWSVAKGQEEREHKMKRRKADWFGHIFRRNCLVQHVVDGKVEERIEVTERWGKRR